MTRDTLLARVSDLLKRGGTEDAADLIRELEKACISTPLDRCNAAIPGKGGKVARTIKLRQRCANPRIKGSVLCAAHEIAGGESAGTNGRYIGTCMVAALLKARADRG